MKLSRYETGALKEIRRWEKQRPGGLHKKLLDVTSRPVEYLVRTMGLDKLKTFETTIEKTVRNLLYASTYTIDPEELIERARARGVLVNDVSELRTCDLALLDDCNRRHINFHERAGAIQGAVAGLGGALTAVGDVAALLVEDFHMIQEIAYCYAYEPDDPFEKEIILRIIEIAVGSSQIKSKVLKEIEALKRRAGRESQRRSARRRGVAVLGAKALQEYVEHLTAALLIRLIPRAMPIISMVVSAHSNYEIIEDSGKTGFMVYRKRFIDRKRRL